MHGIVKKLGVIEKILAYLKECVHVDGKVKLLVLLQTLHNMTVVILAFLCLTLLTFFVLVFYTEDKYLVTFGIAIYI